jgi:hypothetical protein
MTKNQNEPYYSFTSGPSGASNLNTNNGLPSYEEAILPLSDTQPLPPSNRPNLEGYVLDPASAPSNLNNQSKTSNKPSIEHQENFQGRPSPPNYSVYRAKFKTTESCVISRDKHINRDSEALLQFLYQQNTPPKMAVRIRGKFGFLFYMLFTKEMRQVIVRKRYGYQDQAETMMVILLRIVSPRQGW